MSLLLVLNPTIVGVTPLRESIAEQGAKFPLAVSSLIVPEQRTHEGILVQSTSLMWLRIVQALGKDWSVAYQIPYGKWEEIVAGAFKEAGYDEVTLTPRSGDYGRDVIARRKGVGCVKVLGSVKAYKQVRDSRPTNGNPRFRGCILPSTAITLLLRPFNRRHSLSCRLLRC
jgi:hypothetical protein